MLLLTFHDFPVHNTWTFPYPTNVGQARLQVFIYYPRFWPYLSMVDRKESSSHDYHLFTTLTTRAAGPCSSFMRSSCCFVSRSLHALDPVGAAARTETAVGNLW